MYQDRMRAQNGKWKNKNKKLKDDQIPFSWFHECINVQQLIKLIVNYILKIVFYKNINFTIKIG
jgi:hypothetical protein